MHVHTANETKVPIGDKDIIKKKRKAASHGPRHSSPSRSHDSGHYRLQEGGSWRQTSVLGSQGQEQARRPEDYVAELENPQEGL